MNYGVDDGSDTATQHNYSFNMLRNSIIYFPDDIPFHFVALHALVVVYINARFPIQFVLGL